MTMGCFVDVLYGYDCFGALRGEQVHLQLQQLLGQINEPPYLKAHHAEFWEGARAKLAQYNLDDLKAKESGPVLSAQDILDLSLKNLRSLIIYLDITTMPEPRETARQDLIQAGILDRRCA